MSGRRSQLLQAGRSCRIPNIKSKTPVASNGTHLNLTDFYLIYFQMQPGDWRGCFLAWVECSDALWRTESEAHPSGLQPEKPVLSPPSQAQRAVENPELNSAPGPEVACDGFGDSGSKSKSSIRCDVFDLQHIAHRLGDFEMLSGNMFHFRTSCHEDARRKHARTTGKEGMVKDW